MNWKQPRRPAPKAAFEPTYESFVEWHKVNCPRVWCGEPSHGGFQVPCSDGIGDFGACFAANYENSAVRCLQHFFSTEGAAAGMGGGHSARIVTRAPTPGARPVPRDVFETQRRANAARNPA